MKNVSYGHLTLNDSVVHNISWDYYLDGQSVAPQDDGLENWNHLSTVGVSCTVTVELEEIRRTLEIANDLVLSWQIVAKCKPSPIAIASQSIAIVSGRQEISLTLPPGSISGQLSLELSLIVSVPSKFKVAGFAPNTVGQTVYRTQTKLILEGTAGQLPLLPVSFAEHGVPHASTSLWWLRFLSRDLDESANSSLWLWLNTDNPELEPLIEQSEPMIGSLWLKFLKVDFVRQLLTEALRNPELDLGYSYPEGSLGEMLSGVVRLVGASKSDVRAEYDDDPGRVEAKLQALVNGT